MTLCFNERELAALAGLPHIVVRLYMLVLRPWMDGRTGMVGAAPHLRSWQAVREGLYVEPIPGVASVELSRHAMRRMSLHLERAGLLKVWSDAAERQLIFELLLAPRDNSVQKQAALQAALPVHRGKTPQAALQAAQHLTTGSTGYIKVLNQYTRAAALVDNSALIYPSGLGPLVNRSLRELIGKSKLNGSAQPVLDELQARIDRNPVCISPMAYAARLVVKAQRGDFVPSQKAADVARARGDSIRAQPPSATAAKAALGAMLKNLKGGA